MSDFADVPKLLGDPRARAERRHALDGPHMAPFVTFVAALRHELGEGYAVPDFDPWDGGTMAEVLFLLEAPGARAVASGFISRNNPDETAKNLLEISRSAGIDRRRTVLWNAVPWYIGTGTRIRAATRVDVAAGAPSLARLLDLLPHLRAVVLVGRSAQRAEPAIRALRPDLRVFRSPHPSPLFVNRRPGNRDILLDAWRAVAEFLGERHVPDER